MSLFNSASIASAGLYTQTLEAMMYSPSTNVLPKKSGFRDENLEKKKKTVSRLVEKFESCNLDETIDTVMNEMVAQDKEFVQNDPKVERKDALDAENDRKLIQNGQKWSKTVSTEVGQDRAHRVQNDQNMTISAGNHVFEAKTAPKSLRTAILEFQNHQKETVRNPVAQATKASKSPIYNVTTVQNCPKPSKTATFEVQIPPKSARTMSKRVAQAKHQNLTKLVNFSPETQENGTFKIRKSIKTIQKDGAQSPPTPKPRTTLPKLESPEDFYRGIQATSSPLPTVTRNYCTPSPPTVRPIVETPILQKTSANPKTLNFGILDSNTPTGSTCSSGASSASSTSSNQGIRVQQEELDIYLKIARAHIHREFPKYYKWDRQTLRTVSTEVARMRLDALNEIPESRQDETLQNMVQMYRKCIDGQVSKEMDTLTVSIFHLMEHHIHEKTMSIYEEYVAMKYSKNL